MDDKTLSTGVLNKTYPVEKEEKFGMQARVDKDWLSKEPSCFAKKLTNSASFLSSFNHELLTSRGRGI